MKYHLQLLKKYISIDASPEHIAENLILKTCEIEEIITRKIQDSIVIAKVESVAKHPDADKLNVCQVDCGDKGKYQIVCGGTNVAPGIYVPVALVGTHFADSGITIAKRAMRGVDSEGMICSKQELGIPEDTDQHWIWDMSQDLEITDEDLGIPLRIKFEWLETTILEVDNKSLTNRPDLTWHFGAAVELNAIYPDSQKKYHKITEYMESFDATKISDLLEHTSKKLERAIHCTSPAVNTYIALELENITVGKTDFFTRLQLIDLGGKPLNNWVDFSNLFMNISGQPIHCFDADKVKGALHLRNANDGEVFVDLFGVEHQLIASDLVLADEEKILALPGVIGGLSSAISETTSKILVEIANFDPVVVRKTGTRLGLRTDAELRFEKNINPEFSLYALLLFLDELKFYAKGLGNYEITGLTSYINPALTLGSKKIIPAPKVQIQSLIFGREEEEFAQGMDQILTDLWFKVLGEEVIVPIWRGPDDMNIKEDIAEEVARIRGYEKISDQPLLAQLKDQPMSAEVEITRSLESLLVDSLHFDQVETYPWTSAQLIQQGGGNSEELYQLQNPLHPDFPYLRDRIWYNLLPIAQKNSKFFDRFDYFDIGKTWNRIRKLTSHQIDSRYAEDHLNEELTLGVMSYRKTITHRNQDPILEMKGLLSRIIAHLGIKGKIQIEKSDFTPFHPKKQAKIILRNGPVPVELGLIATLHPLLLKNNKFPETAQITFLELNLDQLKSLMHQQSLEKEYATLQDQILWRDLSFVVEKSESFENLISAIQKVKGVQAVRVFDLYQGDNLWADKKSISLQLQIKGDGSMTTEEINAILQSAIQKGESVGASLRA